MLIPLTAGGSLAWGQNVPRATVVEDETPRRATVVEDDDVPRAIPVGPDGRPLSSRPTANQPTGPEEDLFSYAGLLYERGEYALALHSFGEYLNLYPRGRHLETVLFRVGECYVKLGDEAQSAPYFETVVERYPDSEGAPSAAYRLAAIHFNRREFREAVKFFRFCESHTQVPQVRLAAAYHRSRAHQMLGDGAGQEEALLSVAAVTDGNPFREDALLQLAKMAMAADDLDRALKLYQELAAAPETKDPVRAEALINAGVIEAERGHQDEAVALFEKGLKIPSAEPGSRAIALVGVLQALYDKGDYDGVIDHYTRNATVLPEGAARGKMLLLVGNAYRMKKIYSRSVELYLMVEQDYPETEAAFEAGYWKLYCFYLLDDPDLAEFAGAFLNRWAKQHPEHEFTAKAALIRADFYFNRAEYTEAASAFQDIPMDALPEALQPNALFNMGYSLLEAKRDQEAISTYTRFLEAFPNNELRSNALAQRGLAYRHVQDLANARRDFEMVDEEFPKSPAAELALYQLGLVSGEENNAEAKKAAFQALVNRFPKSQAVPQAWYEIGSACYELEQWDAAEDALERAIRLDPEAYTDSGYQLLIVCHYAEEDAEGLAKTIDAFLKRKPEGLVPPNILGWLGLTFFSKEDYPDCARFLKMAVTPDAPQDTQPVLWNYLGMSEVEEGEYAPAIIALEHYLDATPQPGPERGKALLFRSRAELGLKKFARATETADEALQFIKTGRLQAELLLHEGDILFVQGEEAQAQANGDAAQQKFRAAAAKYIIPSQFFVDPEITPLAIWKTQRALEKAGDKSRAQQMQDLLKEKYPDYQPPTD
ncbi:MAG: tetratricopeptide repeat protein [Verrucomicrobiales bacterium]|nr:tetratricopeptide repeat protein [Verrucomicrobiales bacterium]